MGLRNAGKVLCQEVDFDIETLNLTFGTSGRRCSQSPLDGRLATTLVATIFNVIFFPPFSTILLRRDLFS